MSRMNTKERVPFVPHYLIILFLEDEEVDVLSYTDPIEWEKDIRFFTKEGKSLAAYPKNSPVKVEMEVKINIIEDSLKHG